MVGAGEHCGFAGRGGAAAGCHASESAKPPGKRARAGCRAARCHWAIGARLSRLRSTTSMLRVRSGALHRWLAVFLPFQSRWRSESPPGCSEALPCGEPSESARPPALAVPPAQFMLYQEPDPGRRLGRRRQDPACSEYTSKSPPAQTYLAALPVLDLRSPGH